MRKYIVTGPETMKINKYLRSLGIRTDNLRTAILPYSVLTLVLILGSLIVLKLFGPMLINTYKKLYSFFFLSIPLSIFQEMVFRGYGMYKLKSLFKNPVVVIVLNSILFSIFHLLIPNHQIIVPLAFLSGLGFATVYYYFPNLFLVSLVHVIINLVVIPVCYFQVISC